MPRPMRTFVALDISEAVRKRALQLIEQLRAAEVDVRWVLAENLHVTLKFLGDVDASDVTEVCRAVERAASGVAPFEMQSHGAGAFPNLDRPRIVWLGVGQGAAQVSGLFDRIDASLGEVGYAREQRKFHPHMTLGRIRRGWKGVADLADGLRRRAEFDAGSTEVSEVLVYASQLGREGPRYEVIGRTRLTGNG